MTRPTRLRCVLAWKLRLVFLTLCLLAAGRVVHSADAPQISVQVDRVEIYEGDSVRYRIQWSGFEEEPKPELRGFDAFEVTFLRAQPSSFRSITIVQGRRREVVELGGTFDYLLTPKRSGQLSVPAPVLVVGGKEHFGEAVSLRVKPAQEQDHVLLDVSASRDEVFPMQPFDVTLKVAVKPVPDPYGDENPVFVQRSPLQLSIPWASSDQLPAGLRPTSPEERWLGELPTARGGFVVNGKPSNSTIDDVFGSLLGDSPFRRETVAYHPTPRRVTRPDAKGQRLEYWEYTLTRTLTGDTPGEFALGRTELRGVVAGRVDTRGRMEGIEVYAFAHPLKVRVKDAPVAGRPDSYVGAIGVFEVDADMSPREAKVGDPMTLTLQLKGRGTLDRALAPKLEEMEAISKEFKVYDPVETTRDDSRLFTYSLRPRAAGVTEFPPVELSYFDVEREEFVSLQTPPIPIRISDADRLAGGDIAMATASPREEGNLEARSEGIFANVTDLRQLRDETVRPDRWLLGLGSLAGLFLVVALVTQRIQRLKSDAGLLRRRAAASVAKQRLGEAIRELQAGRTKSGAEHLSTALVGLVADLSNSVGEGLTWVDAVHRLEHLAIEPGIIQRFRQVMQACDDTKYGAANEAVAQLAEQAETLLADLVQSLKSRKPLS